MEQNSETLRPLTPIEGRVLGSLIEKSIVTPDIYPITLNALVNACNQKSNRQPVMHVTDADVIQAIDELRYTHRLAIQTATAGSRVPKYKHALSNRVHLDERLTALLCELLLRGPQTVGELRTHAARMAPMPSLEEIENDLVEMADGPSPLTVKLPREPGRREVRYHHLLCGMPNMDMLTRPPEEPARQTLSERNARIETLETTVAELKADLAALHDVFDQFKKQFE